MATFIKAQHIEKINPIIIPAKDLAVGCSPREVLIKARVCWCYFVGIQFKDCFVATYKLSLVHLGGR